MSKRRGIFIAIDGIDGSGKTTLSGQLEILLADYDPETTKEPTAESEWGRRLRRSAQEGRLPRDVEIEYFHKDRLHHIRNFIIPCLEDGRIIICDRYVDSTLAFQARDEAEADVMYNEFTQDILVPDITFILRCPVHLGLQRINENRPEKSAFETTETLERAHQIYESRLAKGGGYVGVDASGRIDVTLEQVLRAISIKFPDLRQNLLNSFSRNFPEKTIDI
jgi:dTMP kinase